MVFKNKKRVNQTFSALLSILVLLSMSLAMIGAFTEFDCADDCAEESGNCCECLCCPTKIVMNISDQNESNCEFGVFLFSLNKNAPAGEQVWYSSIDHPPQNLA